MEKDNNDNDNYLPDLDNEKTGEQIVFDQKVFRANENFWWKMQDLITWFKSPSDSHVYPKNAMNNKHTYRRHASLFEFDKKKNVLYKRVKNSDGIGEYNLIVFQICTFWYFETCIPYVNAKYLLCNYLHIICKNGGLKL